MALRLRLDPAVGTVQLSWHFTVNYLPLEATGNLCINAELQNYELLLELRQQTRSQAMCKTKLQSLSIHLMPGQADAESARLYPCFSPTVCVIIGAQL